MNPLERLPHRPPFRLLDRALMVEPGSWAVAIKQVSRGDSFCDALGRWPAVLLAEVMAQTAGLAVAEAADVALIAKMNRVRCARPVAAGDRLLCTARVARRFGASAIVRVALRAGTRRCAAAEIVLHFVSAT